MRSEFNTSCGRDQGILVALLHLSRKFVLQNVGRSEWVRSQNDLVLGGVRIGMDCMNLVTAISRCTRIPVWKIMLTSHWY